MASGVASPPEELPAEHPLADLPAGELLERLASRDPTPGGGGGVALTIAAGAALAAMAARLAGRRIPDAALVVQQLDALRRHALLLMDRDAASYKRVLEATPERRPAALAAACDPPMLLAQVGAEVTEAAVRLALQGNPRLAADARAGALLAEGGVRTAVGLVRANLAGVPNADGRGALMERVAARAHLALRQLAAGDEQNAL